MRNGRASPRIVPRATHSYSAEPVHLNATFLSRLQFAFTVSFHIIFPSFSIGLAAWLAVLEGLHLRTGRPVYRRAFDLWLKVFGIAFGMGVVSGIAMAFQFGTNWGRLSAITGPIQGPLLAYESLTAFALEASFFGVMLFGRSKVPPRLYFISTIMVSVGTTLSAFWIMANNSWMQAPVGYAVRNGQFVPTNWAAILLSPVLWVRFPHMLLAAYLTGAMCVAACGAWYLLRHESTEEAVLMLRMGLALAAVLIPVQLFFGHLNGDYVHDRQPPKFAAIEGRWHTEQPAAEVLFAIPDPSAERNRFAISIPRLGSFIASLSWDSKEVGLTSFPPADRPPVLIPFFCFRIMVGCGILMWIVSWLGVWHMAKGTLERRRTLLRCIFLAFVLPFIATLAGWFTAEVGRQPWVVYGLLRTRDAVSAGLSGPAVLTSLILFCSLYAIVFGFGTTVIFRILKAGPFEIVPTVPGNAKRPLAFAPRADPDARIAPRTRT